MDLLELAVKPFAVGPSRVTSADICRAIDALANLPERFKSIALAPFLAPEGDAWARQEATNRLMQRWRKLGLAVFEQPGRWRLTRGSWDKLQSARAQQPIEQRDAP